MAEIRIEEKSTTVWPWILGLLLLGAAAFLFFMNDEEDNLEATNIPAVEDKMEKKEEIADIYKTQSKGLEVTAAEYKAAVPMQVAKFAAYVDNPDAEMNLAHDYSRKALRLLANSLSAMTDAYDIENVDLQSAKKMMMDKVDFLDNDPMDTSHADHLKEAFMAATNVMEQIQRKHLPDMTEAINATAKEAKDVSKDELTLTQKTDVKTFFKNASMTLEKMSIALEQKTTM